MKAVLNMKTILTVACFSLKSVWLALCLPLSDGRRRPPSLRYATLRPALTVLLVAPLHAAEPATHDEPNRPQLHFTPAKGWLNDPVGMFYHEGEYHLHYLWAPGKANGMGWGDTWVHLVSKDMLHWQELAPSVPGAGGAIGGGSVVVDTKNTSGLRSGAENPLVLFWNSMKSIPGDGFVGGPWRAEQRVHTAHSTDRGRTWTLSTGNPILAPNDGNEDFRDPSVIWHEATQRWVMLVCRGYHDRDPEDQLTLHYGSAKELQSLRQEHVQLRDQTIGGTCTLLADKGIKGELFEVVAEFEIGKAQEFGIEFCKGPAGSFKVGYEVNGKSTEARAQRDRHSRKHRGSTEGQTLGSSRVFSGISLVLSGIGTAGSLSAGYSKTKTPISVGLRPAPHRIKP
ncbi:MAG: hypothetical protein EBS01_03030 [Verrucomicrobia bacterium]|nr:hypothetical protein [Verrucomicrobiota bacterium]